MKNSNIKNNQLGYYLTGLIEGDGCIWTPKTLRSNNGSGYIWYPRIEITFNIKERPFFEHLKSNLNAGYIKHVKNNTCKYTVADVKKLIEIIHLINGKFRTPKIMSLYKTIDFLNLTRNLNIEKLPLDDSNLDNNSWLSGMIDSDGGFQIGLTGNYKIDGSSNKSQVKRSFALKQRILDKLSGESCIPFMLKIANYLKSRIYYNKDNSMHVTITSQYQILLLKFYLDKYPLMTSKYLDYLCFLQSLNYSGRRLTSDEIIEIRIIKSSMNNKRTNFDWNHLNNFYK